ncbi:MAG: hypothetical protein JWO72_1107 [Caulobacteraceae bacterium]|nr:hypothetical protein [Caulobacteraceae bacterium]
MHKGQILVALVCALLASVGAPARAQQQLGADLNVSPRRVVFEANSRAQTVLIFNAGTQPATYNIELVDRVMMLDGRILTIAESPQTPDAAAVVGRLKSAKAFVNFTPRRVTLAPGESQTIRVRALRPADLPAGEYRTHLTVTASPPEDLGLTAEQAAAPSSAVLSVRLATLFSVAIPMIVRQGAADQRAGVENLHYIAADAAAGGRSADKPTLSVDVVRKGGNSLYGDVEVREVRQRRGGEPIGAMRGFGVYPEIDRRTVQVPLNRKLVSGEKLEVVFKDADSTTGRMLATESFVAP